MHAAHLREGPLRLEVGRGQAARNNFAQEREVTLLIVLRRVVLDVRRESVRRRVRRARVHAVAALAPSELGPALHKVGLQEEAAALLLDAAPGCELTPDDAARKLATHVRSQAARRDRHDAVCRRVAAACRAQHSDVRRDAPAAWSEASKDEL